VLQHDLLAELNKTHPLVFYVTVHFRDKTVTVSESKGLWEYVLDYQVFSTSPVSTSAEEVLYAYGTRK